MRVEGGQVRPQDASVNFTPAPLVHPTPQGSEADRPLYLAVSDLAKFKLHRLEDRLADVPQFAEALAWYRAKLGLHSPNPSQAALASPQLGRARSNSMPYGLMRPPSGAPFRPEGQPAHSLPSPKHH